MSVRSDALGLRCIVPPLRAIFRGTVLLLTLLLAGAGVGCANYRLGTGANLPVRTLYVETVENASGVPQAVVLFTNQLREALLRDGRVRLVDSAADADAALFVKLTRYGREVATVLPNDTGLARKFHLTLDATASLRDDRSGKVFFADRPLVARRQAYTDDPGASGQFGNQRQSEYQALPLLAESLAQAAARSVLDVW